MNFGEDSMLDDAETTQRMSIQMPGAAASDGAAAPLFGVLIPGGTVRTDFCPADASGTKFTLALLSLPLAASSSPAAVSDLVFFLLAPTLPEDCGAMLYWQASLLPAAPGSETGFELLGAITPNKPSAIFRTGWGSHDLLASLLRSPAPANILITLGVSVEPLANIANLSLEKQGGVVEDRRFVARHVALDLFHYMASFDTTNNTSPATKGWMTVPTNIVEKWMERFERKFKIDPNFFMKDSSSN